MAEWVTHLWVADEVLKLFPGLDRHGFCVGNIAPDCNLLNEEGTDFVPSRQITHWMNGKRKTADDCKEFCDKYVLSRMDEIKTKEELAFLLGYYSHLITDAELQRTIRDPKRVAAAWERIKEVPELADKAKGQPEDWDTVKRLFSREDRMKDFFCMEREYLDDHPNSGWYTEIKGLEYFPDYIDYLPEQSVPKKIKMMYYDPSGEMSPYPFLTFSREEYRGFVERAIALVIEAMKDTVPSLMADYSQVVIETENLIMKKAVFDDWKPLYRNIKSRPESARYMLWKVEESEEESKSRMLRTLDFQKKEKYALIVYLKTDGKPEPIGFATMREVEPGIYEDMGIAVGPDFVGKGYGKQILNALCEEAKEQGAKEFRCSYREKNLASKGLQDACGFEFDYRSEEKTDPRTGETYVVVNTRKSL